MITLGVAIVLAIVIVYLMHKLEVQRKHTEYWKHRAMSHILRRVSGG